jgi:hypothetical protein
VLTRFAILRLSPSELMQVPRHRFTSALLSSPAAKAVIESPLIWLLFGAPFFFLWAGTIPAIRWNAIEMMIGANVLAGHGPIVGVLDPPAIWRPPLGWLLCACGELFVRDPLLLFQGLYTFCITAFLAASFYVAKRTWGLAAAHATCVFILASPGVTSILIDHQHGLSHIVFLMTISPAIAATFMAMERGTAKWLTLAGISWAIAYYARPDAVILFAISCLFLLFSTLRKHRPAQLLFVLGSFLAMLAPYNLYTRYVASHYGVTGPSALSTFYGSEAWANGSNDEEAGYSQAIDKYGAIEHYHDSLLLFLLRRPDVGLSRLRLNVPKLLELYAGGFLCRTIWLIGLLFVVGDLIWLKRRRIEYLYCFCLFGGSFALCLYHIDTRYATIAIAPVMFILCGGVSAFWMGAVRIRWRGAMVCAALCLVLAVFYVGRGAYRSLEDRGQAGQYGSAWASIRALKALAADFNLHIHGGWHAVVVQPASRSVMNPMDTSLVFPYFAGTGVLWSAVGRYPRDKYFSMVPKRADYVYVPKDALTDTDILLRGSPISAVDAGSGEQYYLFDSRLGASPIDQLGEADLERLRGILWARYGELVGRFENARRLSNATVHLINQGVVPIGPVGCGVLALQGNGRPNRLFEVEFNGIRDSAARPAITSVLLERQNPWGIYETSAAHFVLGVARHPGGPLVNTRDGNIQVPVEQGLKMWLYACQDGADTPSSVYRATVGIGFLSLTSQPVQVGSTESRTAQRR